MARLLYIEASPRKERSASLEHILGFIGFSDFKNILVEPTLVSPEDKEKIMETAKQQAKSVAAGF